MRKGPPVPQGARARFPAWAPSSVRATLYRSAYRGVVTWNRTRKRNHWGVRQHAARPTTDWLDVSAPHLQIIPDDLWTAAHTRLDAARGVYLRATHGQRFGRPLLGNPSKYLLTNLALCGVCGGPLRVRSRRSKRHTSARRFAFTPCAAYYERGRTVCANNADVPMPDADAVLIETLLDDVIDPPLIADAVEVAVDLLRAPNHHDRLEALDAEIETVDQECRRLTAAIAAGGPLAELVTALQARERRRGVLRTERDAVRTQTRLQASDTATVRRDLVGLANEWRRVLADDPTVARPIISSLLKGRVTFTPVPHVRGSGR